MSAVTNSGRFLSASDFAEAVFGFWAMEFVVLAWVTR